MGLDVSHDCWHGAYSGFMRFRRNLCLQVGVDIYSLFQYGGNKSSAAIMKHDIMPLISHSDCNGEFTVEESKKIVKGLKSILESFDDSLGHDFDFKDRIKQFIKGLELAISKNETVDFC